MNEYYVEVIETHRIYVEANDEDEALEIAVDKIGNQVPDEIDAKIIQDESYTAILYEDNGVITEDLATYDIAEDAIFFAETHHWNEVVNDTTGEIIWRK